MLSAFLSARLPAWLVAALLLMESVSGQRTSVGVALAPARWFNAAKDIPEDCRQVLQLRWWLLRRREQYWGALRGCRAVASPEEYWEDQEATGCCLW